jgi:hypothetical protein
MPGPPEVFWHAPHTQVIENVCSSNAVEIATFIGDIRVLQGQVAQLQAELAGCSQPLQAAGGAVAGTSRQLADLLAVQAS